MDLLARISACLGEQTDTRAALVALGPLIGERVPFTHADICLHDTPGWVVSYEVGIETRWSRRRTRIAFSPVRAVLLGECDVMHSDNAMEDARYVFAGACCEPILNHSLRARINLPMRVLGRVSGTLNISHQTAGLYGAPEIAVLRRIAAVAGPYFHALQAAEQAQQAAHLHDCETTRAEGLRQGALELTQALERERRRIGMDLHDQTLADLTRILRDLESGPAPERAVLVGRITDTINDLRALIDTAVPTMLDLFGFNHALRVHLERAVGTTATTTEIIDDTAGAVDRLDPTTRTALFRIAQEAINNAARHARAFEIWVEITADPAGRLCVSVVDDGIGIDNPSGRQSGLAHIRTRADLIGADLQILCHSGTRVSVALAGADA
ncbi:sensor histidine kinase [Rhodobacteraceae bacterium]|nr:sensor histidine kinase [Paracoccaceae bacterium]